MKDIHGQDTINNITSGHNKTFCILPFISLTCQQNGAMSLCCEDDGVREKSVLGNIRDMDIEEYFNSEGIRDVRRKMFAGENTKYCSKCYKSESRGIQSKRNLSNQKFKRYFKEVFENTNFQTGETKQKISYIDIRFSNICNLACKMCSSFSSSSREKIEIELDRDPEYIHSIYNSFWSVEDFKNITPDLREVYIVGGEPFIHKQFKELLIYLHDNDYAKNIYLRVNTNLTIIDKEIFGLLKGFKKVGFLISCDGYKDSYNKIRLGGNWELFYNNFLYLLEFRKENNHVHIRSNVVVQIDNICQITQIYSFFEGYNVHINFLLLTLPKYFSIGILPDDFRKKRLHEIKDFTYCHKKRERDFKDIITALKGGLVDNDLLKKYMAETVISKKYIMSHMTNSAQS